MPIIFPNHSITSTSNDMIITNSNAVSYTKMVANAPWKEAGKAMFAASDNNGWTWMVASTWTEIQMTLCSVNVNNCFNTTTGRFTAPVAGLYTFTFSSLLHMEEANTYIHPMLLVNSSATARRGGATDRPYRIRGYGKPAQAQADTQIQDIFQLQAGDYVSPWFISSTATARYYRRFTLFSGVYLGK